LEELTYRASGVDIDEAERFVRLLKPLAERTRRPEVLKGIGTFGGLFRLDVSRYRRPVLVSGTDGVGTKLKVAFMLQRHDTVGVDLVAMCANDILTLGAEPLFFLDYLATERLRAQVALQVLEGIVRGCQEAGMSLLGGETAEMPGFYSPGEYDLCGFAVGVVEEEEIIDGSAISEGDALVGLASSGLHSNGYSLARKVLLERAGLGPQDRPQGLDCTLGEELLRPTRIYVKAFKALKDKVQIKGMAHITGGGVPGNLPRMLPEGLKAVIREGSWPVQPVFELIQSHGPVAKEEMHRTFNMGLGFVMALSQAEAPRAVEVLNKEGYPSYIIGHIEKGTEGVVYAQS
jgi:phosphoribosylformylglycinamidine cyclo-ligase